MKRAITRLPVCAASDDELMPLILFIFGYGVLPELSLRSIALLSSMSTFTSTAKWVVSTNRRTQIILSNM